MDQNGPTDPPARFRVRVDAGDTTLGWFTECSAVTIERSVERAPEGGVNDHTDWLPGGVQHLNVTLKRGVMEPGLWTWFQKGLYDAAVERRQIAIILLDSEHVEQRRWDLADAMPVRWSGAQLIAGSRTAAVETLVIGQGHNAPPNQAVLPGRMARTGGLTPGDGRTGARAGQDGSGTPGGELLQRSPAPGAAQGAGSGQGPEGLSGPSGGEQWAARRDDLPELARRVFALLRREVMMERERGGGSSAW